MPHSKACSREVCGVKTGTARGGILCGSAGVAAGYVTIPRGEGAFG